MRITLFILVIFGGGACATAQESADTWEYSLTPYVWLPTISGKLKYDLPPGGGGSPIFSVGPTDWLDLLNFGVLVSGSARKGRLSVFADLVYLSMTSKNDGRIIAVDDGGTRIPVDVSIVLDTRADMDGLVWTLAGGYALQESESSRLDVFAGVRFFGVDTAVRWDLTSEITTPGGTTVLPAQGSLNAGTDLWDGIVGIRGYTALGEGNWSVPYYIDVGTGSSELTWNATAGLAYKFNWGDLLMVYRHLEYDQGADDLLQDFSFSGPVVGATFRF